MFEKSVNDFANIGQESVVKSALPRARKVFVELLIVIAFIIVLIAIGISRGSGKNRVSTRRRAASEQQDGARLAAANLPGLNSASDFCAAAGIQPSTLNWLLYKTERHYVAFSIPKSNGAHRPILSPKSKLKSAQRWILANILEPALRAHGASLKMLPAHGFIRGRSIITNAQRHTGKEIVVGMDLKDFFPTIRIPRVRGMFQSLGYSPTIAWLLARLTCIQGRLPQGAPTSPAISNLVCRKLDHRLWHLARRFNGVYTRYADDLAFSGDKKFKANLPRFLPLATEIIVEEGFHLNQRKTRFARKGSRQVVTGLVVNRAPAVPRTERRRLRALLYNAKKAGSLGSQNRAAHPRFVESLRGRIAQLGSVQPEHATRLAEQFVQLT